MSLIDDVYKTAYAKYQGQNKRPVGVVCRPDIYEQIRAETIPGKLSPNVGPVLPIYCGAKMKAAWHIFYDADLLREYLNRDAKMPPFPAPVQTSSP